MSLSLSLRAELPGPAHRHSAGYAPLGVGKRPLQPTISVRAVAPVVQNAPGVIRLRIVAHRDGVDFMWVFVSPSAAPFVSCAPWQLCGRCMRDGMAGALDQPALAQRYRRILDHGRAQAFEQIHRVQDQQHLVVHWVVPLSDGVEVTLTDLSAPRHEALAQRSAGARA